MTKALTFIEIDVDRCSLTYGNSPCTASLDSSPPTGARKCFNSIATCQDPDNFDNDPVTIRFAIDASYLPDDIECIPCLVSVDFSPSIVSLGVDLGQRASLKAMFRDHRDADTGPHGDPYLADRAYDPFNQGTFFGKFRARNPYLRGRNLRLIRGVVGQSIGAMETRHFIIESFDGPLPDGSFSITAKDVLKLADGDRAQAPVLSNGYLQAGIDDDDTALTLSPAGIGNEEYPNTGSGTHYAAIGGKEIVSYTRSGDSITITARALFGTEAVAHDAQDRFQVCKVYDGEDPADIVADLLENYAGVDASYIPIADWQTETDAYLQRLYTTCIPEPVAVSTLLKELIEQAALALAWDDEAQEIKLQVLRGILTSAQRFTEDNTIEGTIASREQPDKQVTRVWTYFGMINPLRPVQEPDNYRSAAETIDADTEANYGAASIKKIFSRWIPSGGRNVAERLNAIQIARYKAPPRKFNLDLWRDGESEPNLLAGARVWGWFIQDDTGAATDVPVQIIRVNPQAERFKIEAEEVRFDVPDDFNDRIVTIEVSDFNFDARDAYDDLYPAPDNGTEVTFRLFAGAIVGSVSTSLPAFDVGDWPTETATGNRTSGSPILTGLSIDTGELAVGMTVAGTGIPTGSKILTIDSSDQITLDANATSGSGTSTTLTIYTVLITIEIVGRTQGKGGDGGVGGTVYSQFGKDGTGGGTALYTRYPITITGTGQVYGGGGGGGGGSGGFPPPFLWQDGGVGGGGRGYQPGTYGGATTESAGAGGGGVGAGGAGGDAGAAGNSGASYDGGTPGAGGAAGNAIDGESFITETGSLTVSGPRVN